MMFPIELSDVIGRVRCSSHRLAQFIQNRSSSFREHVTDSCTFNDLAVNVQLDRNVLRRRITRTSGYTAVKKDSCPHIRLHSVECTLFRLHGKALTTRASLQASVCYSAMKLPVYQRHSHLFYQTLLLDVMPSKWSNSNLNLRDLLKASLSSLHHNSSAGVSCLASKQSNDFASAYPERRCSGRQNAFIFKTLGLRNPDEISVSCVSL